MPATWEDHPSPAAAELLREAARFLLEHSHELVDEVDRAVTAAFPDRLREDVTIAAEAAASTRANILHWASARSAIPAPASRPTSSPEVLGIARVGVRRGEDQMLLGTYHAGQNVVWRYSMQLLVRAVVGRGRRCGRPLTLQRARCSTSSTTRSRRSRSRSSGSGPSSRAGTHAERLEVVNLILEGAPITSERASTRLRYDLRRRHTAAIVWTDPGSEDTGELDGAAEALARAAGAERPLTVIASSSSRWVWFMAPDDADPDAVRAAIEDVPRVRVALGFPAAGIEGFRRSHLDAVATQRLMYNVPGAMRVARYADVQLVALAAQDVDRAGEFVARTLGDLASASPELRNTVRTYIDEQFSASRAARALFAHRNTVLDRLQRAEQLLPAGLEGRGVEVGLALEIVHWLGPRVSGASA